MNKSHPQILNLFRESGALMEGHFVLRSGLHSGHYFQCARVCENLERVDRLAALLLEKLGAIAFETVLAPAMGGLVIGQEVARQARKRFIFAEKEEGVLVLRRGFAIREGERILVVEDVITRGGRVREALEIIKREGGRTVAVAVLVDRSEGKTRFPVPHTALLELSFPTYLPEALPEELAALPIEKPGS